MFDIINKSSFKRTVNQVKDFRKKRTGIDYSKLDIKYTPMNIKDFINYLEIKFRAYESINKPSD